jgi:hypothetical protein
VDSVLRAYVLGDASLEEATEAIRELCRPFVREEFLTDATLSADVKWYANVWRKRNNIAKPVARVKQPALPAPASK